ncbi:hypothetical protein [Rubrivirga sp.]|uniref:hypothetical protein n=1 Tax=Rubrivirga sp. TaxID=1885344 RepID=UPI003C70B607
MRIFFLLFALCVAGCDAGIPEPETGWIEGTVVLPDGTSFDFRNEARSFMFEYSGLGTRDQVVVRSAYVGPLCNGPDPCISVGISQAGLQFIPGTYDARFDGTGTNVGATFLISDVPGFVSGSPPFSPSDVSASYPEGTVTLRVQGGVVSGTFDLQGWPLDGGTYGGVSVSDLEVVAPRVQGRFEVPVPRHP